MRTGIIWRGQVPISSISVLRKPALADSETAGYVNISLVGEPDLVMVLKEPAMLERLLGRKKEVRLVGLSVDETGTFQKDVSSRFVV